MTVHRFLYKFCWRTKLLLPLVFLVCIVAMVILLSGSGGRIEYTAEGKLRIQYEHIHALQPRHAHTWENEVIAGNGEKVIIFPSSPAPDNNQPVYQSDLDRYLDANRQNALLFKKNRTRESETDPLLKEPLVEKVYHVRSKEGDKAAGGVKRKSRRVKVPPVHSTTLFYNRSHPPEDFMYWRESEQSMCDGKFVGYSNEFAVLKDVIVEKKHCKSQRKGGEFLEEVVNQPEDLEYLTYEIGCFQVPCKERPNYFFNNHNHLNDYLMGLQTKDVDYSHVDRVQKEFTIAVTRYEYANIYHTMTDWYNAFMLMQFMNKTQAETNILIVDAHPRGVLDPVWPILFKSAIRLNQLPPRTLFIDLAWNQLGYNSLLLNHYSMSLPLVEEFRSFVLDSYRVFSHHKLDCDKLKVLFIWRRDYVAHPRNPKGTVQRKVQNERDLITTLQRRYRDFRISGVQIDLFDMQQQLKFVAQADIMIGMHGAGLTHAFFLPKQSALIELVPSYWSAANDHFSAIANWRGLNYQRWVNEDPHNEAPNFYTKIPIPVIKVLIKNAINSLCKKEETVGDAENKETGEIQMDREDQAKQGEEIEKIDLAENVAKEEQGKQEASQGRGGERVVGPKHEASDVLDSDNVRAEVKKEKAALLYDDHKKSNVIAESKELVKSNLVNFEDTKSEVGVKRQRHKTVLTQKEVENIVLDKGEEDRILRFKPQKSPQYNGNNEPNKDFRENTFVFQNDLRLNQNSKGMDQGQGLSASQPSVIKSSTTQKTFNQYNAEEVRVQKSANQPAFINNVNSQIFKRPSDFHEANQMPKDVPNYLSNVDQNVNNVRRNYEQGNFIQQVPLEKYTRLSKNRQTQQKYLHTDFAAQQNILPDTRLSQTNNNFQYVVNKMEPIASQQEMLNMAAVNDKDTNNFRFIPNNNFNSLRENKNAIPQMADISNQKPFFDIAQQQPSNFLQNNGHRPLEKTLFQGDRVKPNSQPLNTKSGFPGKNIPLINGEGFVPQEKVGHENAVKHTEIEDSKKKNVRTYSNQNPGAYVIEQQIVPDKVSLSANQLPQQRSKSNQLTSSQKYQKIPIQQQAQVQIPVAQQVPVQQVQGQIPVAQQVLMQQVQGQIPVAQQNPVQQVQGQIPIAEQVLVQQVQGQIPVARQAPVHQVQEQMIPVAQQNPVQQVQGQIPIAQPLAKWSNKQDSLAQESQQAMQRHIQEAKQAEVQYPAQSDPIQGQPINQDSLSRRARVLESESQKQQTAKHKIS